MRLSKYLYGKNKCKISCPLFLYFIINEEDTYRNECYEKEKDLDSKINIDKEKEIINEEATSIINGKPRNTESQLFLK